MRLETTTISIPRINVKEIENESKKNKTNESIYQYLLIKSISPNTHKSRFGIATNFGFSIYSCTESKLNFMYNVSEDRFSVS